MSSLGFTGESPWYETGYKVESPFPVVARLLHEYTPKPFLTIVLLCTTPPGQGPVRRKVHDRLCESAGFAANGMEGVEAVQGIIDRDASAKIVMPSSNGYQTCGERARIGKAS